MKHLFLALAVGGSLLTQCAASPVLYDFTGTVVSSIPGSGGAFAFTYTAPDFVATDTTVLPGPTLTCNPACASVGLLPTHPGTPTDSNEVRFTAPGGGTYFFYFGPTAFQTAGVHSTILLPGVNDGTLAVAPVPEPGTGLLMLMVVPPLAVLGLYVSRRFSAVKGFRAAFRHRMRDTEPADKKRLCARIRRDVQFRLPS